MNAIRNIISVMLMLICPVVRKQHSDRENIFLFFCTFEASTQPMFLLHEVQKNLGHCAAAHSF